MSAPADLLLLTLQALERTLHRCKGPRREPVRNGRHWRGSKALLLSEITEMKMLIDTPDEIGSSEGVLTDICKVLEKFLSVSNEAVRYSNKTLRLRLQDLCNNIEEVSAGDMIDTNKPVAFLSSFSSEQLSTLTSELNIHNIVLSQEENDKPLRWGADNRPWESAVSIPNARDLFLRLYRAMKKDWCCRCQYLHTINLRLNASASCDSAEGLEVDFFFYSGPIPYRWQEGNITVQNLEAEPTRKRKRARFDDYPSKSSISTACIGSICKHVSATKHRNSCLRMELENETFHEISPSKKTHDNLQIEPAISLETILRRHGTFTLLGKRVLAVVLAKSILPLLDTPWLSSLWTKSNIHFAYQRDQRLSEPFLSTESYCEITAPYAESSMHPWPALLSLGILLWEIELGRPIDEFWDTHDLDQSGQPTANTNYSAALRLLDDRKEDLYPGYREAMETCLHPDLPYDPNSQAPNAADELNEEEWQAIYMKIVSPLEDDLRSGSKDLLAETWSETVKTLSDIWRASPLRCWRPPPSGTTGIRWDNTKGTAVPLGPPVLSPQPVAENEFRLRAMKQQRIDLIPQVEYLIYDDVSTAQSNEKLKDSRVWLQRMQDIFARRFGDSQAGSKIKIALLDSGYDASDTVIKAGIQSGRIVEEKSFMPGCPADRDEVGHGTHILALLLQQAPHADMYVARVSRSDSQSIDEIGVVAKAIHWAIDQGVDIIAMSFGIRKHGPVRVEIEHALKKAAEQDIIMFAAASNNGANDGRAFPASDDRVICVHSTDGKGTPSGFSPRAKKDCPNFAVPGECIKSSWPRHSGVPDGTAIKSGTSFATPVAVSVAANVLRYGREHLGRELYAKLRSLRGIKAIFNLMEDDQSHAKDHYNYLVPWHLFDDRREDAHIIRMMEEKLDR